MLGDELRPGFGPGPGVERLQAGRVGVALGEAIEDALVGVEGDERDEVGGQLADRSGEEAHGPGAQPEVEVDQPGRLRLLFPQQCGAQVERQASSPLPPI